MEAASSWRINRTMQDVLFDHQCPNSVVLNRSEDDWEALAQARHLNATRGLLGIYDNLQRCFKGNLHTPGFLKRPGKGQFVIDIGLGFDAKETRDAVKNGFTVFAFEMLPGNIQEIQKLVSGDSRFHFVELRKEGDRWILPELPKPAGNTGFAYIINAAVSDEEMTVMFSVKQTHSLIESVDTGKKEGKPVPVLPLHKLLPSWLPHVDYLKVDTQGHELKVLRGCQKLFEEGRCRYITFEFSPLLMKHAKSGDPLVLLKLLPSMGALCYTASAPHEHLRPGAAWPLEEWFQLLDTGSWLGYKGIVKGGFGAWVDLLCTWPVTTLHSPKTAAKWTVNRTVRELMLDHQCPDKVKYNLSEDDRSALERTRMSNAEMARFGIFDDLQDCFERSSKMPGFLEKPGAGQFVIDIGVGWEAKEMRLAVQNGFTVFAFEMLPGNIQEIKQLVSGDSRFHFLELRKEGDRWKLPELPKPTGSAGIAYVINAAVWDEETTVTFPDSLRRSHTESVTTGRDEGRAVPALPLHKLLPKWLPHVDYLRIETQGHELKVLRGCERVLREPHSRYIQFVFAPWLIKRTQKGDPLELLQFLPRLGALCYTASSPKLHLRRGAPWPLEEWLKLLDEGNFTGYYRPVGTKDHYKMWMYGPWVDILCYWPFTSSSIEETTSSQSSLGLGAPLEVTAPGEQHLQQMLLQKPPMAQPQAVFANSMSVWAGVVPLIFGWCILVALRCLRYCR